MPNGLPCCSIEKPPIVTSGDCGRGCVTPGCATRLRLSTSTTWAARGLDRTLFQAMIAGKWIEEAQNLIIEGPAGVGKSWWLRALGHKACRDNRSVLYQRVPRMFSDLALARGDGATPTDARPRRRQAADPRRLGARAARTEQRHDMLEIVEDRYGRGATLIAGQSRSTAGMT